VLRDRFLSLVLGVPSSGGQTFPFDETVKWLTVEDVYNMQLCTIAGLIVDRNQADLTHAFSTTQNIDEKLDSLAKQMSSSWWELPSVDPSLNDEELATQYDRLLVQLWHFDLESQVHLPFMLRAATDRRYEYSRISCLAASRGLITRWLFLLNRTSTPLVCRVYEFQSFTHSIILLLGILQSSCKLKDKEQIKQEEDDMNLVNSVQQVFEDLQKIKVDQVLTQSIEVLKTLKAVDFTDGRPGNLRLAIPHFGTISVTKGGASHRPDPPLRILPTTQSASSTQGTNMQADFHIDPAMQNWQNVPVAQQAYPTPPMLSFTSSHFPTLSADMGMGLGEWSFKDEDVMLFDSLVNTDLEGNWNF
jgi:hypothetical protein